MTYRYPPDDATTVSRPRVDLSMSASVGDDNQYAGSADDFCHQQNTASAAVTGLFLLLSLHTCQLALV